MAPSKEVKEGFATWVASTVAGQVWPGLKVEETPAQVVLETPTGGTYRFSELTS